MAVIFCIIKSFIQLIDILYDNKCYFQYYTRINEIHVTLMTAMTFYSLSWLLQLKIRNIMTL